MLTIPSFQEQPIEVIDLLKVYLDVKGDSPLEKLHQLEKDRIQKTEEVLAAIAGKKGLGKVFGKLKARAVRLLVKATHGSIAFRERVRLKQALLYNRLRGVLLAMGQQLVAEGCFKHQTDIFFLTYREILDFISGKTFLPNGIQSLVDLRKKDHATQSQFNPPDDFTLPRGHYYSNNSICEQPCDSTHSQNSLKGTGACGGTIISRATLLDNSGQAHLISSGDILVTQQTDPGWGPIFYLIKGLVIQRGGMLSHGAILAREFGIPTVVGIQDAMQRIPNHCQLSVDGDQGIVKIID